jgi:hypothetical protein
VQIHLQLHGQNALHKWRNNLIMLHYKPFYIFL